MSAAHDKDVFVGESPRFVTPPPCVEGLLVKKALTGNIIVAEDGTVDNPKFWPSCGMDLTGVNKMMKGKRNDMLAKLELRQSSSSLSAEDLAKFRGIAPLLLKYGGDEEESAEVRDTLLRESIRKPAINCRAFPCSDYSYDETSRKAKELIDSVEFETEG
jgi:hypothetical protein